MSICIAVSTIGGVIAPYFQLLGSVYWLPIPYIAYGASALVAAVTFFFFIPETKRFKLKDKLDVD